MYNELLEQFDSITEEIELERKVELERLISLLAATMIEKEENSNSSYEADAHTGERRWKHNLSMVSLLCLRIEIGCQLICARYLGKQEQLCQDISKVIELVENLEYKWEVTDSVIRDAFDLMVSVCSGYEETIKIHSGYSISDNLIGHEEITEEVYELFIEVYKYFMNTGRQKRAYALLEKLCNLSRFRNGVDLHRNIVISVMAELMSKAPEISLRIASLDISKFEDKTDEWSGYFYWFYAVCLQQLKKNSESVEMYQKCYAVRKKIYGEDNWFTVLAKRGQAMIEFSCFEVLESVEYLSRFVDDLERDLYAMQVNKENRDVIEGETLYVILARGKEQISLEAYDFYLRIYDELCKRYEYVGNPCISRRLAWDLRGDYYLRKEDWIQAESAFLTSLSLSASVEESELLNEMQIKSNLLLIYYIQNDADKVVPLLLELLDLLEDNNADIKLAEKDKYRVYTVMVNSISQGMMQIDDDGTYEIKQLLETSGRELLMENVSTIDSVKEQIVFILAAIGYLVAEEKVSRDEESLYLDMLSRLEKELEALGLNTAQKIMFYYYVALLSWDLGQAEAELYFKKAISILKNSNTLVSANMVIYQSAAVFYGEMGKQDTGILYLNRAMNYITDMWHGYTKYLNDFRLIQILESAQSIFGFCYAMLRQIMDVTVTYERLLQFKALASLAGRERNRILRTGNFESELISRIQYLQNKVAEIESANIFFATSAGDDAKEQELRKLENEIAKRFPDSIDFIDITWNRVQKAIPDNSAIVEYFFTVSGYGHGQSELTLSDEQTMVIDIYITRKTNRVCTLNRITANDGMALLEKTKELVLLMQDGAGNSVAENRKNRLWNLRKDLYSSLVKPALSYIGEVETVYIAPDNELLNLPFEILYDEAGLRLIDNYQIVKIECARDFLFNTPRKSPVKRNLIIGNPLYKVETNEFNGKKCEKYDSKKFIEEKIEDIKQLPFAELEVKRVAKRMKDTAIIGIEATKRIFLSAEGYENLHIATHGDFGDSNNALYSSVLVFAGMQNWLCTKITSEKYGNGMVSADEISRMDLSSTKLVVLSSCLSGMNEIIYSKGFHGMISALAAAGAEFVISHLWEADDFSTAIFMDAFYYYYAERKETPPVALRKAQIYLRRVTVRQLKDIGWFEEAKRGTLDADNLRRVFDIESSSDTLQPFAEETYWGGFACCCCNWHE